MLTPGAYIPEMPAFDTAAVPATRRNGQQVGFQMHYLVKLGMAYIRNGGAYFDAFNIITAVLNTRRGGFPDALPGLAGDDVFSCQMSDA